MDVILSGLGSAGDVHPMVGLALRLRSRGHRVALMANPYFADLCARLDLELVPIGTVEDFREVMQNPDLWHPVRGVRTVLEFGIVPSARAVYEVLRERYVPGRTVATAHSLDLGSRIAQEKLGIPVASVHLAPVVFRSTRRAPRLPLTLWSERVPAWIKRLQFWVGDRFFVDPILGGPLNALRAELGLAPVQRFFGPWYHSPQRVIGLFPDWFGLPQPDWPPQAVLTGFPLWDEDEVTDLDPKLEQFLGEGSPPIVFTPGSANLHGSDFFLEAIDACTRLGRRGILLTRHPEQLPAQMPASVRHFDYVPFGRLLPRAAALVHHGGIGTLSQALAAGVPHLVRPLAHDQFDNAARLSELGVGAELLPRRFRGPAVAAALSRLLESPDVKARCRELADRIRGADPLEETCQLIEQLEGTDGAVRGTEGQTVGKDSAQALKSKIEMRN